MRIPNAPGLGNRTAEVVGGPRPQQGDGGIGAAAGRLGNAIQDHALTGMDMQRREDMRLEHEQKQQAQAAQRAQAALTLATITNEAHDAHDEVARGVLDGTIPAAEAETKFSERVSKLRDDRLQSLDDVQRGVIADNLVNSEGTLRRNLRGVVIKRQQGETAMSIDQFGEETGRAVSRLGPEAAAGKYDAFIDFTGPAAGMAPDVIAKKKQAFRETAHTVWFDDQATKALTAGDVAGLGRVLEELRSPAGEPLSPEKRTMLEHRVHGYQQHLLAKQAAAVNTAAREGEKREKEATDEFERARDILFTGGALSPEYIRTLTGKAAGTSVSAAAGQLIASQAQVAGFASQGADQRAASIEAMRARRSTSGTDPAGEKLLGHMVQVDSKLRSAFADNPWTAAQSAGVIQNAKLVETASAADVVSVVGERMKVIGTVEAWGKAKVSPLQPAEAEQVGKLVRALPVDQASTLLGNLGAAVGDHERVAALAKQMKDRDAPLGLAMVYANTQTTQGRHVAELILRGDQAIRDKVVKPDDVAELGWHADIAKAIRGAYSHRGAEDQVIEAAFLIAAAKKGEKVSTAVENAIRLATGGGIIDFNGARVPMPVGFANREDEFRKAIATADPSQFADQIPDGKVYVAGRPLEAASEFVTRLKDAQLAHAGPGRYWVKAGSTLVSNARGEPIVLKVAPR